MKLRAFRLPALFLGIALSHVPSAWAFNIDFDYSYDASGFFSDTTRKNVLDSAASYFESIITDDLLAINSSGDNYFNVSFMNPSTGAIQTINDFSVPEDTLTIFVGARDLGGSILGQGGPGGYSVGGTTEFVTNALTRGETTTIAGVRNENGNTAIDFAPWGGSISFNSTASWYFDQDTSTDESFEGFDFYSVALHELGHVLGIGTADSWDNKISNGQFTGANAVAAYGGSVPVTNDGGHWAQNTQSTLPGTTTTQEAAMDPDITASERKRFTTLDNAGLEDVGGEMSDASN